MTKCEREQGSVSSEWSWVTTASHRVLMRSLDVPEKSIDRRKELSNRVELEVVGEAGALRESVAWMAALICAADSQINLKNG